MKRSIFALIMALALIFNLGMSALAYTETDAPDVDVDTDGNGDFNIDFDALTKTEGSETNPIKVEKQADMPAILVVPANGELWYEITTDMNGKYITINGNTNTVVNLNGVEYLPNPQGVIQVKLDGQTTNKLQVSNISSSNGNWSTTVGNPAGSQESPLIINTTALTSLSVAGHDTLYVQMQNVTGKELTIATAEGMTVKCNGTTMTADERGYVTILGSGTTTLELTNSTDGWITVPASLKDPLGSQTNPFDLVWTWNDEQTLGTASITIPAKTTQYFKVYVSGYELYVNNVYNCDATGTAKNPQIVGINNNNTVAVTFNLKLGYALGTAENPDELVLGTTFVEVEEDFGGYHLNWTAEETGYLTLIMDGDGWRYEILNLTTGNVLAEGWSTDDGAAECTVDVTADDQIQLVVSTYDPWAWFDPAGTIIFDASFSTEKICKHSNTTVIKGTAATCTASGLTDGKKCADCGETLTAQTVIPAKGHTEVTVAGKAATCTETGLTEGKKCSVCGVTTVAQTAIPVLSHNYVDGTCSNCGAADPNAIVKFDIDVARMILGNALEFQFGVATSKIPDKTGYYAVIEKTWADGTTTTKTIPAEEWGKSGNYHAVVYDGLAAKEMGDTFYVTIYNAKGQAVSNAKEDSVRAYVARAFASQKAAGKTMMVDMLNYGAAAQVYTNYGTDDLANNKLTDAQKAAGTSTTPVMENKLVKGTNYSGSRFILTSRIQVQMAFKNLTSDMYAVYTYTSAKGEAKTVRVEGADFVVIGGKPAGVELSQLVYADARTMVEVTVYKADGTVHGTATDSIESCCVRSSGDLFVALMKFADSAKTALFG